MTDSPPQSVEQTEIYLGTVTLREDGVIYFVSKATPEYGLEHAREHTDTYESLGGGKKMPILADIRLVTRQADRAARKHYASPEGSRFVGAIAMLIGSDVTRMLANFFFRFNRPPYPMRMFTDEKEALAWLAELET